VSAPDTAPDTGRAALERRYRRLLHCYPPGHREEMLGVLLAAGPWQDALAVVSL
jgi:hypothetical protein